MTDRTKALDELIAGDADLYDVPPEAMVDEWLAECTDGRVSSHTITMLRTFARWNDARHRIASARITGDKDRRESQSSAPTDAKIKALVEEVRSFLDFSGWSKYPRIHAMVRLNAALAAFEGDV